MRRISGHSLIFIRETSDKRKLTKEKDATCVYACYSRDLDSLFQDIFQLIGDTQVKFMPTVTWARGGKE